jgi:GntR family transcriptional regulator
MPQIDEVPHKYQQIAAQIRDRILNGELRPGDPVASERDLAAEWKVARPTASKALNALRLQGYVESRLGSGTFVRERVPAPRARERYERVDQYRLALDEDESVQLPSVAVVVAPAHVAAALGISPGDVVIERTRVVHQELVGPVRLSTSWFPAGLSEVAPRLSEPTRIRGGTVRYLESVTGRRAGVARDTVCARLASSEERRYLGLARPSAVLVYRLTVHDIDDAVLQYDEACYPSGRWMFRQQYPFRG